MKQRTRVLLSVSLGCLLLVTAVVAGRWVYAASPGWRFFDIEFHPSWSEEERAAILRLDEKLRGEYETLYSFLDDVSWAELAAETRAHMAETVRLLEDVAACGRGDVYGRDGCQPAWYAAWMNEGLLVKSLVQRGANPNKPYRLPGLAADAPLLESDVLCAVVSHAGCSSREMSEMDAKEALELAEWLLSNGADWRKSPQARLAPCVVMGAMNSHEEDAAAAAELATRMCIRMKGLPDDWMSSLVSALMNQRHVSGLPYLRRLEAAGLLPGRVLETDDGSVLRFLHISHPYAEENLRWLLDEMKLDVNYRGMTPPEPVRSAAGEEAAYEFRRMYPLSSILRYKIAPKSAAERARCLACLELLLQRGARYCRADFGEKNIPGIRELLDKYPEQEEKQP